MTFQTILVEGWQDVDVREVIRAMPPNSMIVNADPQPDTIELDELVSWRVH